MQPTLPPDAQIAAATEEERRRQANEGTDGGAEVVADIAELSLDGALTAVVEGASAVAEGAVNLVGAVIGGIADI